MNPPSVPSAKTLAAIQEARELPPGRFAVAKELFDELSNSITLANLDCEVGFTVSRKLVDGNHSGTAAPFGNSK